MEFWYSHLRRLTHQPLCNKCPKSCQHSGRSRASFWPHCMWEIVGKPIQWRASHKPSSTGNQPRVPREQKAIILAATLHLPDVFPRVYQQKKREACDRLCFWGLYLVGGWALAILQLKSSRKLICLESSVDQSPVEAGDDSVGMVWILELFLTYLFPLKM